MSKEPNYRKLLVEFCKAFSEEGWSEIEKKCKSITHNIVWEKLLIEIKFLVNTRGERFFSYDVWNSFSQFRNNNYSKFIRLKIDGFVFKNSELNSIVARLLGKKTVKVNIKDDRSIVIDAESDDNCSLFVWVINFLFGEGLDISLVEKNEGNLKKELELDQSKTTKVKGDSNLEGDYCCFKLEERTDHGGNKKFKVGLSDLKDFYWLSIPNRNKEEFNSEELFRKFEINKWYRCKFSLNNRANFANSLDGFLNEAIRLEEHEDGLGIQTHIDECEFGKICAVSVHTKNSAFDGLYRAKDMVQEAVGRGHKAIGLTDLGSVQSFAEFEKCVKDAGIKGLYGVELEIIPDKAPILIGGYEENWLDSHIRVGGELCKDWDGQSYSVLDIETTGLNPFVDEIIQISVKKFYFVDSCLPVKDKSELIFKSSSKKINQEDLKGFRKIDEFDSYVKINKEISQKITELTHINNEIIDEFGRDVVEVLKELKEFLKGSVIVAHNGIAFDIPFINAHLRRHNLGEIQETVLDTLKLSHYLFRNQKFKSHALAALSKKALIPYDEDEAHNATYDVDVLSKVFFTYMMPKLKDQDSFTSDRLREINDYFWKKEKKNKNLWGTKILIYVKNQKGVKDLYKLVSLAHTDYYSDGVKLARGEIDEKKRKNLIVVSNPLESDLLEAILKDDKALFKQLVSWYDYVIIPPFSHFLHEVGRGFMTEEEVRGIIRCFVDWCEEYKVKWFFNGAVRYIDLKRDYEKYSVLVNTKGISGKRHYLYSYKDSNKELPNLEFKYSDQLLEEYRGIWDDETWMGYISKSIKTQDEFIDSIEDDIEVIKKKLYAPKIDKCDDLLKEVCESKLKEKYGEETDEFLLNRYKVEVDSLIENNFSVIYWVSYLLVNKSVEEGYLVGSRGSVGSSFVAYLMDISEVNPLPPHYYCKDCSYFELQQSWKESGFDLPDKDCPKCSKNLSRDGHDIPFETFLGFGGNKVPDIDLNFSGEYQLKAHDFLLNHFGKEKVFRAGTIGTMAEKTALAVVEEYATDQRLKFNKGKKVWLSENIVDVKRTTGQHPGGILVVPEDKSIYEFSPINYPANDTSGSWLTTHFAFEDLHDALLKFDILGHDDPTTLKILKELTGVDPLTVPTQDPKLVELYRSCEAMDIKPGDLIEGETTGALGLPEFGTVLTRKIIKACQPKTFADLMRISGFSHGTGVWKRNIELLVKDKENYPLNSVITCRDDIMLYLIRVGLDRESAFNITESIRKGKGVSKKYEKLMRDKGVPDWYIKSSKQITYIFPKSHATAYVMMSWKIAFYKLYYPLAFYSAYFTTSLDHFDLELLSKNDLVAIKKRYEEITGMMKNPSTKGAVKSKDKSKLVVYEVAYEFLLRGFKFDPVCLNKSLLGAFYCDDKSSSLRIPLKAVDGLGEAVSKEIIEGRRSGYYKSIDDIHSRGGIKGSTTKKLQQAGILPANVAISDIIFDENGDLKVFNN